MTCCFSRKKYPLDGSDAEVIIADVLSPTGIAIDPERDHHRKILDIPIRFPANQPQQIPFWTGYNSGLSEYKSEFSVVSYAPIIEPVQKTLEICPSLQTVTLINL